MSETEEPTTEEPTTEEGDGSEGETLVDPAAPEGAPEVEDDDADDVGG